MKPEISYFYRDHLWKRINTFKLQMGILTQRKKGEVQIKIRDDNVKTFIATLYNAIFAPDL